MLNLYKRELYLKKIRPFINVTSLIKVLSGVRRSGKSSIMELIVEELLTNNINAKSNKIRHIECHNRLNILNSIENKRALFSPFLTIYTFMVNISTSSITITKNMSYITNSNIFMLY